MISVDGRRLRDSEMWEICFYKFENTIYKSHNRKQTFDLSLLLVAFSITNILQIEHFVLGQVTVSVITCPHLSHPR